MTATDQQILITRTFEAPRERVFAAWTEPEQVAAWFGPEGFHTPVESVHIELRPGGRFELTMVRDGKSYPVRYEIVELVPPELIVMRHEAVPEMGLPDVTFTRVEFHDHGERTRMTLSDGPYEDPRGADTGWNMSFDKLSALLA